MSEESIETNDQETIVENNGSMSLEEQAGFKAQLEDERKAHVEAETALASRDERIAALEGDIEAKNAELLLLKEVEERNSALVVELREQSTVALDKYREALLLAHPEIPEALICGESFQALFDSVEKGQSVVEAVSEKLKASAAASSVPAGAPERGEITLNGLSPREKIAAGIKPK